MKRIKAKSNIPLNKNINKYEEYYPVDYNWFNTYLEYINMIALYNDLLNNNIIDNIINNNKNVSNEKIIEEINEENNFRNKINQKEYLSLLKQKNYFKIKHELIKKSKNSNCKYYHNFILLNRETIKTLVNDIYPFSFDKYDCVLGDDYKI